ncbi:flagellin Hag [Thermoanaerobacterium thermosaccharolyticum]|uniref:flagellin Hag n=1 Tax=Thermoanaerobacterium thermosaccharolyticum TaxID=1517 RepID=UPI001239209F|nr:flagellin Hag [Thermoanaerobacterium thermosaccharolyticum]KAA5805861.1 flagellin Hag [Thermoanaerobacterium thermosaccharolyticum]
MVINTNISALNTWRALETNNANTQKALQKLSSGYRINSAADDAAGLAISEKMKSQIAGLNMAQRNAQDGISLIQTAEGALNETSSILQRMRELVVQAGNGTNTPDDLKNIESELGQLASEIDRISGQTQFNTKNLLDGSITGTSALTFQIGANENQIVTLSIGNMSSASILTVSGLSVSVNDSTGTFNTTLLRVSSCFDAASISNDLSAIDNAINTVSAQRGSLGALQNRLEHTINNLGTASENLTAANSRIRDVDMAQEMMEFTKDNILNQAATAMLAQANQLPQTVLQLLR